METSAAVTPEQPRDRYRNTGDKNTRTIVITISCIVLAALVGVYGFNNMLGIGIRLTNSNALLAVLVIAAIGIFIWNMARLGRNGDAQKILDFIVGFLGTIVVGFFFNFFIGLFTIGILNQSSGTIVLLALMLPLLIAVLALIFFARRGYRFITYGILSSFLIPFLVFGACLYSLRNI